MPLRPSLRIFVLTSAAAAVVAAISLAQQPQQQPPASTNAKVYPKRWVYVSRSLRNPEDVDAIRHIVETAAKHGLTGMVLAGGLDRIAAQPPEYFERLRQVKEICDRNGIEIIPSGFNVGYGGALLSQEPELAEGLPVKGALFVVEKGEARFQPEASPEVAKQSAVLSLDSAGADGPPRLQQQVKLRPYRSYRVRLKVRAENAPPSRRLQVSIRAVAPDGRNLNYFDGPINGGGWHEFHSGFNSWYADTVTLSVSAGRARGSSGTILRIEELRIEEVGLLNVIRRPGTPVRVSNDKMVFEEGRDFHRIEDPKRNFKFDHDSPTIRLTANSRIREGDRLRVDYYHGVTIYQSQVPACINEPRVMRIWERQFPLLQKELQPKTYLLALDEVRMGGTCEDCRRRLKDRSMAQVLGEYASNLRELIRKTNPQAEVFVWSDMFDPNHNARDKYYLVDGDYTGSWKYLPKDMRIACWYFAKRNLSLKHFASLGFQTLAGAYYDADDLENPKGWLESLDQTEGAVGIMYTTWERKYDLLPAFGDLVSRRQ